MDIYGGILTRRAVIISLKAIINTGPPAKLESAYKCAGPEPHESIDRDTFRRPRPLATPPHSAKAEKVRGVTMCASIFSVSEKRQTKS